MGVLERRPILTCQCAGSSTVDFATQVRNGHTLLQSYPNYKTVH